MAVVVVLAFLGCILAPALARTSPNSNGIQCLNNLRQLGTAWIMYAEDNRGRLVYNQDGANVGQTGTASWVAGWLDFSGSSDNTNTQMLVNHERYPFGAFLGPYVKSPGPFKCPADKSKALIAGQRLPRVRSISMNGRVGTGGRSWSTPSAFLVYSNTSAIFRPTPSQLFVFVDEREDSINDGSFIVNPDTQWQLIDYPAAWHNGGAGFGFADGHSEIHRWHDPRTMPVLVPGQQLNLGLIMPGNVDVQWLQQHAAARR